VSAKQAPTSYGQRQLWFIDRLESGSPFYNIPVAVRLKGELDRAILDRSLTLPAINEMHDRLIAAAALHLAGASSSMPLLTCDPDITASGLVTVVW